MKDKNQGWISIHRKSLESSVWKNPVVWFVWCWCLLKANHNKNTFPFNGTDIEILPGQFITGIQKATLELPGVTSQMYRTAIKYLENTQRLTTKSTNKFTLITVNKWEEYQDLNKQTNKPLTNQQQTTNKRLTTNNNVNNDNNDNNITSDVTSHKQLDQVNEVFKTFYDLGNKGINFGNKTDRAAAEWLIKTYGLEKTINTIKFAMETNNKPYAPVITTPYQLKNNIAKLMAFYNKEQSNKRFVDLDNL